MNWVRAGIRSVRVVGMFAWAAGELVIRRPESREARAEWLHQFCGRMVRAMGITLRTEGSFPPTGVVIANHVSYLDIVVFAALHRCVFVSKAEIRSWPVLGWMTYMAGTVFVERGRGGSAAKASGGMRAAAEAGIPIVFFPEGTTSDGSEVLRFHSGLLGEALEHRLEVVPAFLRYRLGAGNAPGASIRDHVAYWGDMELLPHIFRFLALRDVVAEVRLGIEPIPFPAEINRKGAATEARDAVCTLAPAQLRQEPAQV